MRPLSKRAHNQLKTLFAKTTPMPGDFEKAAKILQRAGVTRRDMASFCALRGFDGDIASSVIALFPKEKKGKTPSRKDDTHKDEAKVPKPSA